MSTTFEEKLRAALSAGWRVLLIEVAFLLIVWLFYRALAPAQSEALLVLIGPNITWATVTSVWLWGIAAFKLVLWLQAGLLLWGWLWSVMLRKAHEEQERGAGGEARAPIPGPGTPAPTP
jgi:hypothetical protein